MPGECSPIPEDTEESDLLYFYTDPAGLQGILGPQSWPFVLSKCPEDGDGGDGRTYWDDVSYTYGGAAHLLASDVRYMNDAAELTFGLSIFHQAITRSLKEGRFDGAFSDTLRTIGNLIETQDEKLWPWRVFAACFCEDGDLLSQWRGYAGGQGGFAIGFHKEALRHHSYGIHRASHGMLHELPAPTYLAEVTYCQHESFAERVLDDLGQAASDDRLFAAADGTYGESVGYLITRYACQMKQSAFKQEAEWRLTVGTESRRAAKTRARGPRLVPYMDLLINARLGQESKIAPNAVARIVVGPCRDPLAQAEAVRILLEDRSRDGNGWNIPVVPSKATSFIG